MVMQIIFLIVAAITLGAAVMVVTVRNLVHAALWLILALFGVAITFALLNAPFFTVVQVVIYIGAISILMIFAIMLTRRTMQDSGRSVNPGWWLAGFLSLVLFAGLLWMFSTGVFGTALPEVPGELDSGGVGYRTGLPNAYVCLLRSRLRFLALAA
jgi:NADH-quinone oxidoreductase subunit J